MENSIGDLIINGKGSSGGDKFKKVSIMGEGFINGDVECVKFKTCGESDVNGNLKVTDIVDIKGRIGIKGNLETKNLEIRGEIEVNKDLFTEQCKIWGKIDIGGNLNAEIFTLDGGCTIEGLLNADKLKMILSLPCKVHEIGGSDITVKKGGKLMFIGLRDIMGSVKHKELTADIIEGDNVFLENTKAKVVRGTNVKIGPGCEIDLVEYKNDFKQDKGAEVKKSSQKK
ncbi:MAG: hypothetical protein WCF28_02955 [Methanobacterium sp.]|uniref:hypothetical protein n=1 Tax=Methanobacterium sp. TaxID=2164 RepID=UPI003C732E6F